MGRHKRHLLYLHGLKPVLSFTLSGKHMTYTYTHALIHIYSKHIPKVISTMEARRFLRKGCEAFLALILDSKREQVNLENIHVIRELPP